MSAPKPLSAEEFRYAVAISAQSIRWSLDDIARARQQFLDKPDVNALLPALAVYVKSLLATAASVTVMSEVDPQLWAQGGDCAKMPDAAGLASWLSPFARDLNAYFTSRENWSGFKELEVLATHAERVLWGCGCYRSPAGNHVRVDVANEQELALIAHLLSGASFSAPA